MTRALALGGALLMVGCTYTEDDYLLEEASAACAFHVDCYPGLYESVEDCVALRHGEADPACAFDAEAAKRCVEGLEALECPVEGEFPAFPPACDAVYADCGA